MKIDPSKINLVFIDDDELNQMTWSIWAESKNLNIKAYLNVEDFILDQNFYTKDVLIFLDYNLGASKKASDYIPQLRSLGFQKIIIATADQTLDIAEVSDVLAVISKDPNEALKFIQ